MRLCKNIQFETDTFTQLPNPFFGAVWAAKLQTMKRLVIEIKGVAAELVLGNYEPTDLTIMNDWAEFYHYNNVMHDSLLITSHVRDVKINWDGETVFQGLLPSNQVVCQQTMIPALIDQSLYLKTECVEEALYVCEFDIEEFHLADVIFETQDFDQLFKVGQDFLSVIRYENQIKKPEWVSGKPIGNLCLLCQFTGGYFIPKYDAIAKVANAH